MMNQKKYLITIQIWKKTNSSALCLATYPLILLGYLVSSKPSPMSRVYRSCSENLNCLVQYIYFPSLVVIKVVPTMSMRGEGVCSAFEGGVICCCSCQVGDSSLNLWYRQGEKRRCIFSRQCPCTAEFAVPSSHVSSFSVLMASVHSCLFIAF